MEVVDTNVIVVANGKNLNVSIQCVARCAQRLENIKKNGKIVLDDQWLIISEYQKHLSPKGQPGVGDAFLKWILTNRQNPNKCVLTKITSTNDEKNDFKEFPRDKELSTFDPDDRKFIAVSCAIRNRPPILQAIDSNWWKFKEILKRNGIEVIFLCEKDIHKFLYS